MSLKPKPGVRKTARTTGLSSEEAAGEHEPTDEFASLEEVPDDPEDLAASVRRYVQAAVNASTRIPAFRISTAVGPCIIWFSATIAPAAIPTRPVWISLAEVPEDPDDLQPAMRRLIGRALNTDGAVPAFRLKVDSGRAHVSCIVWVEATIAPLSKTPIQASARSSMVFSEVLELLRWECKRDDSSLQGAAHRIERACFVYANWTLFEWTTVDAGHDRHHPKAFRDDLRSIAAKSREIEQLLGGTEAGSQLSKRAEGSRGGSAVRDTLGWLSATASTMSGDLFELKDGRKVAAKTARRRELATAIVDACAFAGIQAGTGKTGPVQRVIAHVYDRLGIMPAHDASNIVSHDVRGILKKGAKKPT